MSTIMPVSFYGDVLNAMRDANGTVWVSGKSVCENLGLDWPSQLKKLKEKPWASMVSITTEREGDYRRTITMVDVITLPGWLFSIDSRKVKPEIADKLIRYQRECATVLANHFMPKPVPVTRGLSHPLLPTPEMIEYSQMRAAVLQLATELQAIQSMEAQIGSLRMMCSLMKQKATRQMQSMFRGDPTSPAQPVLIGARQ